MRHPISRPPRPIVKIACSAGVPDGLEFKLILSKNRLHFDSVVEIGLLLPKCHIPQVPTWFSAHLAVCKRKMPIGLGTERLKGWEWLNSAP
jgi:hypothetical protein